MEYTREQAEQVIKDLNKFREHLTEMFDSQIRFLNHKFPQLPERGWLKHKGGAIVFRTGLHSGYGLNNNKGWDVSETWTFGFNDKNWQPATEEEVVAMLTEQAGKMGYVKGVKVRCLFNGKALELNGLNFQFCFSDGWLWDNGKREQVKIMDNGKWAEIIADDLQERFDALIKEAKERGKNVTVKFE